MGVRRLDRDGLAGPLIGPRLGHVIWRLAKTGAGQVLTILVIKAIFGLGSVIERLLEDEA